MRRVLAGEFAVLNKHLVRRLEALGLWTEEVRTAIIAANGSVQGIEGIPDEIKALFLTAWEMPMKPIIDQAAKRGWMVDQSQSLNLFVAQPSHPKLSSMHFYLWKQGLKGMYYLRTKPAAQAVQVTVPVADGAATKKEAPADVCRRDDPDCLACSA